MFKSSVNFAFLFTTTHLSNMKTTAALISLAIALGVNGAALPAEVSPFHFPSK